MVRLLNPCLSDKHSVKNFEFSPILGVEKSCQEKFTFDISWSYVYQIGSPEYEIVPILPLNWKIWNVPVYIISFVVLGFLTIKIVRPNDNIQMKMTLILSAITSLIITMTATVVDITKCEQPTIDFLRNF